MARLGTKLVDGRTVVAAAGTRVPLVAANAVPEGCQGVVITALEANTGKVVVGASTVVAAAATRRGTPLAPLEKMSIEIDDPSKVWLDAMVSGEGVSFTILQ